ncbi:MAG TPA: hypothetical protein DCG78_01845 [Anaerolineaceae bacterium]|jgi:hypothetical protein|nr:MAG: hypothetical protein XD89_0149 [Anaerolineae bacterium 49_20]HAE85238.1 hypothetical protein [Anaerolineaceae bacterium]
METPPKATATFKDFLPAFIILILAGGGGLALVTLFTLPTLGPRWLFFFFLVLLVSGIALPIAYLLNRRFPSNPPVENTVIIREALLAGILVALLAWMRMGRLLTFPLAILLAAAFILVEFLLRLWERGHWKPQQPNP